MALRTAGPSPGRLIRHAARSSRHICYMPSMLKPHCASDPAATYHSITDLCSSRQASCCASQDACCWHLPTTAQHPYLTSIIVQVPELGGISRPACRRSVTAWARSLPRQSGAVLATNLVAACLRTTRFGMVSGHGWHWRNMPGEAQRPSRALGNETRPTSCWSSAAFAKSAAAVFP